MSDKKILIVGAGAVGQVYGRHLLKGGANVTFLVRDKYRAELEQGYRLYPLNEYQTSDEGLPIANFALLTTHDDVESTQWDQVWLCVSSAALREAWFPKLVGRVGDATIVALQPGLEERDYLVGVIPEHRLVHGIVAFISYPLPLPERYDAAVVLKGNRTAYWLPPFSKMFFSGEPCRRDEVLRLLVAGGIRARSHQDVSKAAAFSSAVLMSLMIGLEASDWSMARFRAGKQIGVAAEAARESLGIAARHYQVKAPWWRGLLGAWGIGALMAAARRWLPLPLEEYFRFHFTKIAPQTRLYTGSYLKLGQDFGLPTKAILKNVGGLQAMKSE